MKTSNQGIDFIKSFEGYRPMPYRDQGGLWTVGFGHLMLKNENYNGGITQDEAQALFSMDLAQKAEEPVNEFVKAPILQQQFDALASLCYNIGAGNFQGSLVLRLLNQHKLPEMVATGFKNWSHANGNFSQGLWNRRIAETNIFLNGVYESP